MADFLPALHWMLPHEGGYNNDAADRGGETYCGIARRFWASWPGWSIIDGRKPSLPAADDAVLAPLVADFYRQEFWIWGDILDQKLANKVFDVSVVMGKKRVIIFLQQAVIACGRVITVDGALGPDTTKAINCCIPEQLLPTFKQELIEQIQRIVTKDPTQARFFHGWMDRAEMMPT